MKKLAFVLYAWGSTFLFAFIIYWLATIPNLSAGDVVTDEVIKVIFRLTLYAILFVLIYRSVIITLKTTVERLSKWRSRKEEAEDSEFVLIVETLVVILVIFATISFAFFEQHVQFYTNGRNGGAEVVFIKKDGLDVAYIPQSSIAEANKGVLISVMSTLLTAIVVYSVPVIGELEVAIKHKLDREIKHKKK
ncbi:MAG: hypothetical protein ABI721_02100 [Candidatus Dojkabacteria bacterium]